MLVKDIPHHLRNTIRYLDLPIYLELEANECRAPGALALGDTLMLLGLLRNHGRPVRLHMESKFQDVLAGHPLVRELVSRPQKPMRIKVRSLPLGRSGRRFSWSSNTFHRLDLPVLPVDQIRGNPVLAHSLYYGLARTDDRPGLFLDPARPPALKGLLSREKPTLVVFPVNPGRGDSPWQDLGWWVELAGRLKKEFSLVAVGAEDYGDFARAADVCLAMSDPGSTIMDLAWLCQQAAGFVGRDGGPAHVASAMNQNVLTVWDSMASYRFWACRSGCHILLSNPYGFRYPQTHRLTLDDLKTHFQRVRLPRPDGDFVEVEMPREGYEQKAAELCGSFSNFTAMILGGLEAGEDRRGVEDWLNNPEVKRDFYDESLDFACRALTGKCRPGENWVAPILHGGGVSFRP